MTFTVVATPLMVVTVVATARVGVGEADPKGDVLIPFKLDVSVAWSFYAYTVSDSVTLMCDTYH